MDLYEWCSLPLPSSLTGLLYVLIRDLLKPPNELHAHVNSMITNCLPDEDDDDDEG